MYGAYLLLMLLFGFMRAGPHVGGFQLFLLSKMDTIEKVLHGVIEPLSAILPWLHANPRPPWACFRSRKREGGAPPPPSTPRGSDKNFSAGK